VCVCVCVGLCPDWPDWTTGTAECRANAAEAMDAAEQWLDIPQVHAAHVSLSLSVHCV